MPGIAQRVNDAYTCTAKGTLPSRSLNGSSVSSNGFWAQHRGDLSYNQLQRFWLELTPQARQNLLRIDKQTLFEHARKNMYCSRCNGLLLEGFLQIIMDGRSLQQDAAGGPYGIRATDNQNDGGLCVADGCLNGVPDPFVHPWGGLTPARDGTLTLLDCYLYSKSLKALQNVFDSARSRERERELIYPDACGGSGRGWISQGIAGYGRGHGSRETCAIHTARMSVETLVDFWSALGEETQQSLLRMKEKDFIERLIYRFDNKRFCRDCRRNVIREFKELKELKRMRRETRCTAWFCVADTTFEYQVSCDTIQADWHQMFSDAFGTYQHFEWAVGTGEGKSDILEFENIGLTGRVQVNGLDLSGLNACYITLRAWKTDGRCDELCVKAHALRGQQCVHCRLVVGEGYVSIRSGESITRFFEHAEDAEEEEDDDSMDKDGSELDGECSRPQKHAKSPELAREFLLHAATVIFKEQVEKAFREGTARQNAHNIFVCLALKLLEEHLHIACKEIITLEKQMKLLEEEEKEKREEEERKERRRTKEREKKLRRKERLRERENREMKVVKTDMDPVVTEVTKEEPRTLDEGANIADFLTERGEDTSYVEDDQLSTEYTYSNMENISEDILAWEFDNTRNWNTTLPYDDLKYSCRKLKFHKDSERDLNSKLSDRHPDGFESTNIFNGCSKHLRTNVSAGSNVRNGSKLNEKFRCSNCRTGDKYASHSCSSDHHQEYRSRPQSHITGVVRDPKYVSRLEGQSDILRPHYRGKNYSRMRCPHEINGRPKSKIFAWNTKKVWEPLDSQKKCVQSNSDSNVTLRPTPKVEASEFDQLPECCSTSSDEVTDSFAETNHKHNDPTDSTRCRDSEESVAEDGELCSMARSPLKTSYLSMTGSSNSDNCSSYQSEGDSNTYSNFHNLDSTSTSDSEESSQKSDRREISQCLGNGITTSHRFVEVQSISTDLDAKSLGLSGTKPLPPVSFSKDAAPCCESGRANTSMGAQPYFVLPPMHNQSINYPVFQAAPTMGYYHQDSVSWPVGPTNGLMTYPYSEHFLFTKTFGYGFSRSAQLMHCGTLQHHAPPIHSHAHVPVFQQISHVNGENTKEPSLSAHPALENVVQHSTQKVASTDQHLACGTLQHHAPPIHNHAHVPVFQPISHVNGENTKEPPLSAQKVASTDQHLAQVPKVVDVGQNERHDSLDMKNNGFSLFHFGGPVVLSTGYKADQVILGEGITGSTYPTSLDSSHDDDRSCNKRDSIEEYNLFAATNGIEFSIF